MKHLQLAVGIVVVYAFTVAAMAQENSTTNHSPTDQIRADIDTQTWANFTRSYKELDAYQDLINRL